MSSISICVKWSGKEYEVSELAPTDTVETLKVSQQHYKPRIIWTNNFKMIFKVKIMEKTGGRPERQKLLNLKVNYHPEHFMKKECLMLQWSGEGESCHG